MKALWLLVKLYLDGMFRFSVIRYAKDAKERRKAVGSLLATVVLVVVYGFMSVSLSLSVFSAGAAAGDPAVAFALLLTVASAFVLVTSFTRAASTLSGFRDFDTLMGLPVRKGVLVASRFLALYLFEELYALALLLPCGVLYAVYLAPPFWFYPLFLLGILIAPILPIAVGGALDLGLECLFAHAKHRKNVMAVVQSVVLIAFLIVVYLAPRYMDVLLSDPNALMLTLGAVYPPADWFAKGLLGSPWGLLYLGVTAVLGAGFYWLVQHNFLALHDRLSTGYHDKRFRLKRQTSSSVARALYRLEWKRYLSSTGWVVNTALSAVMVLAVAIAGGVFLRGALLSMLEVLPKSWNVSAILIAAIVFCATLSPTTCSAISMEGKQIWLAKQLPFTAKAWLASKAEVNLTLTVPATLLASLILIFSFRESLGVWEMVGVLLFPLASLAFSTVLGLWVNLKLPKLEWKNDTEVFKQGMPVLILVGVCFALVAVCALPMLLLPIKWLAAALSAALLGASILLWARLSKKAEILRDNL